MKKMLANIGIALCLLLAFGGYVYLFQTTSHSNETRPAAALKGSGDKILDSIRCGADFLERHQESDGHFSKGWADPKPAFTALIVDALARSPEKYREQEHPFLRKAALAIVAKQQPNGSLCTPVMSLDTYSTAMSVMALTALENPEHRAVIDKAVEFLRSVQYQDDEARNPNFGAPGYNLGGRTSGDMAANWIEALKDAGVKEDDKAFKNAQKFFSRLQNNAETNDRPAEGTAAGNDGGFFYRPGESKPADEIKNGKRVLKSYGLMSYAGLKSFLYMNVPKDDPRVASAYRWVRENYTLDENRNIGPDGLYYYYMALAKALAAYGESTITTADNVKHVWAAELSDKIISLQDPDGSWHNKQSSRWSEDDPVMVTAFAIRTLSICHGEMKQ